MSKVNRFEDLIVWQRAMDLAVIVYEMEACRARDHGLENQMHKSAVSVPSNIAEGFDRGTRAEFHRFLSIAKGSCAELRTQLLLARRIHYFNDSDTDSALALAERVGQLTGKLRSTVQKHRLESRVPRTAYRVPKS